MKKKQTIENNHFIFKIYFNNYILSVLFDLFIKINFVKTTKLKLPDGIKKVYNTHKGLIFKIENEKENGKYVKKYFFFPESKINVKNNNEVHLNIKFLFFNIYKNDRTETFKCKFYQEFGFKDVINKIKDLNRRVDNIFNKKDLIQKLTFPNNEIVNLIKKHKDVDNETMNKLKSLNVNIVSMLFSAYKSYYNGNHNGCSLNYSEFNKTYVDNNNLTHTILLYPASYVKKYKKYLDQPTNIDYGFVYYNSNFFNKLYYRFKYIGINIENGFIASNGNFYNIEEALEIAMITNQIINKNLSELNKNSL